MDRPTTDRRAFLKRMTHALGALFGLLLAIPSIFYLIDPRNRKTPDRTFRRVARLSDLTMPETTTKPEPTQAAIHATRRDAWTLHPDETVGRVWLLRRGEKQVDALTTICPHLGCSINYDATGNRFLCPCHNGTFDLNGNRIAESDIGHTNPAPRGMDRLEVKLTPDSEGTDFFVEVRYQEFVQGLDHPKPKS